MIKFLDLEQQYEGIRQEIDDALRSVIRESAFIGGRYVSKFESEFAAYQQAAHCVGVANGTDALEIAIEALSLPPGSEVLVPANTFIATSEAVTRSGHRVVFCDCDPRTYTIDVSDAGRRVTERTGAIIPVHLYGHPCDMDSVLDLAGKHKLFVIEDCAQAHAAEYKGRRLGAIGDIGTFSFYPGKNLGAFGDAGAIVTNNIDLAKRCRMIANHGRTEKYSHDFEGRNSRLDGLQAAVLSVKLRHLDAWTGLRIDAAERYTRRLKDITGIVVPHQEPWAKHVWHLYVIQTEKRDELQSFLKSRDIQTGIHYPIALPRQKAYAYLQQYPETTTACRLDSRILSLPIGDHLDHAAVEAVADAIRAFCEAHA